MRVPYAFCAKSARSAVEGIPCSTKMLSYRNLGDVERSASTRHDRFVLDSLSRCNIQWAKWLAFQSKTSPVRQSGSGGAGLGYGLGHVWVTFATGCY
jgi:hypothetical protein